MSTWTTPYGSHNREIELPSTVPEYVNWIDSLAQISTKETLFVAEHKRLAKLIQSSRDVQSQDPCDGFAQVYELSERYKPTGVPFREHCSHGNSRQEVNNQLVFLSGYPSTPLLIEIGIHYGIEPAFFDRHMSFVDDSTTTCSIHPAHHSLPSHQQTIFQYSLTSIGGVQGDPTYKDLYAKREDFTKKMREYLHNLALGKNWKPCESIVRGVEVHDIDRFSIEQAVTILVANNKRDMRKWVVIVWLDAGADLADSHPGPWLSSLHGAFSAHFRPFTLYDSDTAFWHRKQAEPRKERNIFIQTGKLPQTIPALVGSYGESLHPAAMATDPIYALHEVFSLLCTSEAYYLDMIYSVTNAAIVSNSLARSLSSSRTTTKRADTHAILINSYRLLERHAEQITGAINFLKSQQRLRADNNNNTDMNTNINIDTNISRSPSALARAALTQNLQDFTYLLRSTTQLQARCSTEAGLIVSAISAEEARRGIEQSKSSHKFTVLAAIYVPLSFSCAFFGMNFVMIDGARHGFQIWAIVTIPVFLLSFMLLAWDSDKIRGWWEGIVLARLTGKKGG